MCRQCNGGSILINTEFAAHLRRLGHQAGPRELPDHSLPTAPPLLPSAPRPAACFCPQRAASPSWHCSAGREVLLVDAEKTEPKGTLNGQEKAITGNKKTRKEEYLTDKSIYTVKVVGQPSIN